MTSLRPLINGFLGAALLAGLTLAAALAGMAARQPDLFTQWSAPTWTTELPRAPGMVATRRAHGPDGLTQGRFAGAEGEAALTFDGALVAWGEASPLRTSPHRILTGDDIWNDQGGRLSTLFDIPRNAQVELRRIEGGYGPPCADGRASAWLMLSHEGSGVALAAVAGEPPPAGSAADLCALARATR